MKINLANIVPFLGLAVVGLFFWASQTSTQADEYDDSYSYYGSYDDTTNADAYLDRLAVELAQPGVYIDPQVIADGGFSAAEAVRLDQVAATTDGPVRVAVVPVAAVREGGPDDDESSYYSRDLAYTEDELVAQLYDRVGADGTYAILVDARSSYDGRSFTAYQYAEERPFYDVEGALDRAVDCCAPDYERMVDAFLEHAGEVKTNLWVVFGWLALGGGLLVGLFVGTTRLFRWRRTKREDAQVADALRPSLTDEVVELSRVVAALPAPPAAIPSSLPPTHQEASGTPLVDRLDQPVLAGAAGGDVPTRTRRVLDLVEDARHRLDLTDGRGRMDTPSEVEDVVRRLADARYELVAIEAIRAGQPVPERTAPCFFDPRHGPSTTERPFKPEFGLERPVPVCAACAAKVDAGQQPEMRTLTVGTQTKPYWQWDRYTRPYVNGYWQRHQFADQTVQRTRFGPAKTVSRHGSGGGGGIQFVWESSGSSGGGGSSSGSGRRSFSGSSGSRRSFGGGSSSRSHSRSGGSRRF